RELEDLRVPGTKDDVRGQADRRGRRDLRIRKRERRRKRPDREGGRRFGQRGREEARDRQANAARQHHRPAHLGCEGAPGAERAQALFRMEGRSTRDRAELQVLSAGNEQDRRDFGGSSRVPRRVLPASRVESALRPASEHAMAECMYWKEVTVNWGESDPFGLVYYPRIVAWFNDTEHDFFRTIGFPIDQMIREDRTTFVMGEIHFRFIGPAAYGDRIATTITLAKISE